MEFSILEKDSLHCKQICMRRFFFNDYACVIFTTAVLGLQAKLPRGWDYLCHWVEVACSGARFCLCLVYEGLGKVQSVSPFL